MNFKKHFIFSGFLLFTSQLFFAFEPISTSDLLMSYLENDIDLKTNAIDAQKAQLTLDSTKISNGFDISLSTGTITVSVDDSGMNVSVKPTVKATLPQASNLSLTASTDFSYSASQTSVEDAKISASVDIISTSGLTRQISLLKAERSLLEAQRKLKNQAIESEKAFYSDLKELLNSTSSIINLQKTLYTDKIDFEKIKTQGYSSSSSTYRLAQMEVTSTEHEIEQSTRSLIHSYIVFYSKCGCKIDIDDSVDFYTLIPKDITDIEPLDIHSFNRDLYSEIESAVWTNKINSMQRKAKSIFSLSADGGVTFNNSTTSSTTIDAGLSSTIGGVSLGGGISVPVNSDSKPAFTFSAGVSPNTFRQNSITAQQDLLDEKEELLAIETANSNFETKVVDCEQTLADLEWTKKSDQESYETYEALEKDLANWYKEGFVTESEYYSAKVNLQSYTVQKIINAIDFIIYNDNIVTMFVDDI